MIGDEGYLDPPRFADEPARHKVLDLLGDLALLGARLRGQVRVDRGGHTLHLVLARAIAGTQHVSERLGHAHAGEVDAAAE